jgi:anthranilate phosphoribosyltransferase|tara:strand:+ start:2369 stop:3400 length:1032 start_codon:yes stop_codon:yes gene_type:complete
MMDMPGAIAKVIAGEDLSRQDMTAVMELIMTGGATPAQIGGFLVGLRIKGETIEEIVAAASVMRALATPVTVGKTNLVDTCGTGGSGSSKFNVSTASAFVAAAAGARVAKHGNRAASGKSGSADVLEAAGANINLDPDGVARCIETVGVGFLFALNHHGAMKHAIGPRREMIVRTIFNMLGPLTNPASAERQLLGVYDAALVAPVASVLKELGSQHVMVVHSDDGLDEISVSAATRVAELKDGVISEYEVSPEDYDVSRVPLDSLRINDSNESLGMLKDALSGSNTGASDIVALNAGAAIYVSGIAQSMEAGVIRAREVVDSGLAEETLKKFVDFTSQFSGPA